MDGEYTIQLEQGTKPFALTVPRRVAIPLMQPVKDELARMETLGVITRVSEPTDWCAGMVIVLKGNGSSHLCGSHLPQQECQIRETSSPSRRTIPRTTCRCPGVFYFTDC